MKLGRISSLLLLVLTLLSATGSFAADAKPAAQGAGITQGQFAAMLVTALHWEKALPEVPLEADYLAILEGRRTFRMEAEEFYDKKTDNAFIKEYPLYGPFTGKGWVSGVSTPTTVHFSLMVPIEGNYTLTVCSKGGVQRWSVGGKTFEVNTGDTLKEATAGVAFLKAGVQEITVDLPAEGGVDYLVLEAPHVASISPLKGWKFNQPLTMGDVAEVAVPLLGWESQLANDAVKPMTISVAEAAKIPTTASTTTVSYLGAFLSKQWVRAGFAPLRLEVPFSLDATAVYRIKVNALGEKVGIDLDGNRMVKEGKAYLDWIDLGFHRLSSGDHTLLLDLLPRGGVDVVTLEKKKSSPEDYMAATGLQGKPSDPVTRAQAEKLLTSFAERFRDRK